MLTRYIIELINCLYHLGIRNGWRYWRCLQNARKDPTMVPAWAKRLKAQAAVTSDEKLRYCYIDFAERLEKVKPQPFNPFHFKAQVLAALFGITALVAATATCLLTHQWFNFTGLAGIENTACLVVASLSIIIYRLASPHRL